MKRELNHVAFKQSIWKANDMDPNPVHTYVHVNVMKTGPLYEWKQKEHEFVNKIIQYIPKPINCMPNCVYNLVTSNERQ
uniref:Uncharacterized protein n=1 Tax=Caenorhabditis japonica TaxID=281687 RepID=A0A8R1I8K1_CAEJA